jgi:hypothetical protein
MHRPGTIARQQLSVGQVEQRAPGVGFRAGARIRRGQVEQRLCGLCVAPGQNSTKRGV